MKVFSHEGSTFWLLALGLVLQVSAASAQTTQNIDGSVPMFCLDSTGVFRPLMGTNYSNLQEGFSRQFGWGHTLRTTSNTAGTLEFSGGATGPGRERIYYEVQPYNGGIALLRMHVRLQGKSENPVGTNMCGMTSMIVSTAAPSPTAGAATDQTAGAALKDPDLSGYPATVYRGPFKMPDFAGRDRGYAGFRTRIRDGLNAGPNFAGHYALIHFGCGTGCSVTFIADVISGQVFDFPLSGEEYSQLDLKFSVTSYLIIGRWIAGDRCKRQYLLWNGSGFKSLGKADIGEESACN